MVQDGNEIAARCSLLILLALALGVHYVVTSRKYVGLYFAFMSVYLHICTY